MTEHDLKQPVFAVVRFDEYLLADVPVQNIVTVKEILPSAEEAEREVCRLNEQASSGVFYTLQQTRWYPHGRRVGQADQQDE